MKEFYIYILASRRNGTLYIGMTSNLKGRVWQHKNKIYEGFTKRYGVDKLVYYEVHLGPNEAIRREKNVKAWKRKWKLELIEKNNPNWIDLSKDWY